jgi:hypothetical protein
MERIVVKPGQVIMTMLPGILLAPFVMAADLPERFDFDGYQSMLNSAMFALVTGVPAPVFAKDLYRKDFIHTAKEIISPLARRAIVLLRFT